MSVSVSVGIQWGDEGKAKIVDYLSEKSDLVVRFQGGANAGHTVYVDETKYVFHLVPTGVIHDKKCLVGAGVVFDIEEYLEESADLQAKGADMSKVFIDERVHLVMPYHKHLDVAKESKRNNKIGTTSRGIGPTYADRASRCGIRLSDLAHKEVFAQKLAENLDFLNFLFKEYYDMPTLDFDTIYNEYLDLYEKIKSSVVDGVKFINDCHDNGDDILFEGAQGTLLDVDYGTYPYVTSSNTVAGAAATGSGLAFNKIDKVYGVFKAYTTRVGNGPFPSELDNECGEDIRQRGFEFGATTGRPRRCGWLDLIVLKHTVMVNGVTDLVLTKVDILSGMKTLKVVRKYLLNGKEISYFPSHTKDVEDLTMIEEDVETWEEDITEIRDYNDLPKACKDYIKMIEDFTGVKVTIVSVGPDREQTFFV